MAVVLSDRAVTARVSEMVSLVSSLVHDARKVIRIADISMYNVIFILFQSQGVVNLLYLSPSTPQAPQSSPLWGNCGIVAIGERSDGGNKREVSTPQAPQSSPRRGDKRGVKKQLMLPRWTLVRCESIVLSQRCLNVWISHYRLKFN